MATSTDVMLVATGGAAAGLPSTGSREGRTQWALAEELLLESGVAAVERLYASAFTTRGAEGAPLGVFVAFVDAGEGAAGDAEEGGGWMDLREACRSADPAWCDTLSGVRDRFVARPPDEALRLR
jgi:hypothetical protein